MPRENDENMSINTGYLRRLLVYLVPYRKMVGAVMGLMMIAALAGQIPPLLFRRIIDQVIPNADLTLMTWIGLTYVTLHLTTWATTTWRSLLMADLGQSVLFDMRKNLFNHIQYLSFDFYDRRPAGKIMARITSDVGTLNDLITNGVVTVIVEALNIVVIMVILLSLNWQLALLSFLTLPALFFVALTMKPRIHRAWKVVREEQSEVNAYLNESIQGMRVTQAFHREERNQGVFGSKLEDLTKSWLGAARLNLVFGPMAELIGAMGTALIIYVAGRSIHAGNLTPGTLVAFISYLGRFWGPVNLMAGFYNQLQSAMSSAERVFEFLDLRPQIQDAPDARTLPVIRGEVDFQGVSFGYEREKMVLHQIDLHVSPGETVAIVGPTGAGKSSIINLINRFYDPNQGTILIDGQDIRGVTLESLRSQIGIVLQDTFLFSGTIGENIRYGKLDATMEEILQAAKIANAHQFIEGFPQGYETESHERGAQLSVGQRQLLAFARALIADPKILVLDEATSSIDTQTERLIQRALERLLEGRTAFVIAHRLSTIRRADTIVVIDGGQICEKGTHEELMTIPGGIYRHLVEAQYSSLA